MPVRMEVLWEDTLRRLFYDGKLEEALSRMRSSTGNPRRVHAALEFLVEYGLEDALGGAPSPKDADISTRIRRFGNDVFRKSVYEGAVEFYSMAVAHAPESSRELALAYGNRSTALARMAKYEIAHEDAKRALDLISEDDALAAKLRDQQAKCRMHEWTSRPKNTNMPFEDIERYNPTIPCASAALELKIDSEFGGRCIFAKENISPGQLLAIERPYLRGLNEHNFYIRCFECCELSFSLIPCKGCRYAMFCSLSCAEKAKAIHQYECSMMYFLFEMDFTSIELRALRTVIKAKTDAGTWTALKEVVERVNAETNLAAKGFVAVENEKIYDSNRYESVHALVTNESIFNKRELLKGCIACAVLVFLLDKHSNFFDDADSEEKNFCGGLILHNFMSAYMNERPRRVQFEVNSDYNKAYQPDVLAFGVYPFLSLFNHSCAPNVCQVHVGSSIALVALRPIAKGKQVFDNYGPNYVTQRRDYRRYELSHRYRFECNCEACLGNWPIFNDLPNANLSNTVIKKLKRISFDETRAGYNPNITLNNFRNALKILDKYAPCTQLVMLQRAVKFYWAQMIHGSLDPELIELRIIFGA